MKRHYLISTQQGSNKTKTCTATNNNKPENQPTVAWNNINSYQHSRGLIRQKDALQPTTTSRRMNRLSHVTTLTNINAGVSKRQKHALQQQQQIPKTTGCHMKRRKASSRLNWHFHNVSRRCAIAQILKNWNRKLSHHHKNGNVLNRTYMDIGPFITKLLDEI
jgi:hypothetical protein